MEAAHAGRAATRAGGLRVERWASVPHQRALRRHGACLRLGLGVAANQKFETSRLAIEVVLEQLLICWRFHAPIVSLRRRGGEVRGS